MKRLSLILLTCLLAAACRMDVEYCNTPHPHRGHVKFNFNWSSQFTQHPQYMDVKAQRVVMHNYYLFETTTLATGNDSTRVIESPDLDVDTLQLVNPADSGHHVLHLRAGEYEFLAYNGHREGFNMIGDTISEPITNDLGIVGPDYVGWRDRNPYSDYLVTADTLHLFSATGHVNIPLDITGDPLYTINFTPRALTQVVNINFTMKPKESGIVVDSIICCMSGVCRSMLISTGEVFFREKTYKVLYKPTFSQDPKYMETFAVKGNIRVPGIVPSKSSGSSTGPGVLQVNIHIHFTDSKNVVHHRILEGSINLYNTLSQTPSLKMSEGGEMAIQTAPTITLNIDNIMQLTRNKIESEPDVNIDKWVDHTPIGVDF